MLMIEILTALLVVITGVYAWLTYRISSATEQATQAVLEQNESLTRPYVVVKPYVASMSRFFLSVENTGASSARNLRLSIDKSFYCIGNESDDLAQTHLFNERVDTFAPGEQVTYFLGLRGNIFSDQADRSQIPLVFKVTAEYSYGSRTVVEERTVDLRQYYDIVEVKPSEMRSLERISRSAEQLVRLAERTERNVNSALQNTVRHNQPPRADEEHVTPASPELSRVRRFVESVSTALRG